MFSVILVGLRLADPHAGGQPRRGAIELGAHPPDAAAAQPPGGRPPRADGGVGRPRRGDGRSGAVVPFWLTQLPDVPAHRHRHAGDAGRVGQPPHRHERPDLARPGRLPRPRRGRRLPGDHGALAPVPARPCSLAGVAGAAGGGGHRPARPAPAGPVPRRHHARASRSVAQNWLHRPGLDGRRRRHAAPARDRRACRSTASTPTTWWCSPGCCWRCSSPAPSCRARSAGRWWPSATTSRRPPPSASTPPGPSSSPFAVSGFIAACAGALYGYGAEQFGPAELPGGRRSAHRVGGRHRRPRVDQRHGLRRAARVRRRPPRRRARDPPDDDGPRPARRPAVPARRLRRPHRPSPRLGRHPPRPPHPAAGPQPRRQIPRSAISGAGSSVLATATTEVVG